MSRLAGALWLATLIGMMCHATPTCTQLAQVTLAGNLRSSNGLSASNYNLSLVPSQQGYIAGCGVNLATVSTCATSTDGSVVGIPNPLTATVNTTSGAGSLGPGTYYTVYEWYDAAGNVTLASPETIKTLSTTGSLVVNPPTSGIPALAVGMDVFIGVTSGGETLQGQTVGSASFVQSSALTSGAAPASSNTTLCQVVANDAVWPSGTGYNVSLTDSRGNPVPNYPMQWQLIGPGTTINLSNGLPYYHGAVYFPVPILAAPANHGTQSISGGLDLGGYFLRNVARVGIGTSTPAWGVDAEGSAANGIVNAKGGYLVNGSGGTTGQCLASDGTAFDAIVPCLTSVTTYYQSVAANGTAQTQRPTLNFSNLFSLTDSSSPAETTVAPVTTGSEAKIVTAAASGTTGDCAKWLTTGGIGDSGSACSLAVSQSNVTSSRSLGGSYTSGVAPLMVEVTVSEASGCTGAGFVITGTSNSISVASSGVYNCDASGPSYASITFLVPASTGYSVTLTNYGTSPTPTLSSWIELPL
jgi:hypothetical protein